MTIKDIEERILAIKTDRGDDESQHHAEDDLYEDVLQAIADGASNASELAKATLATKVIDFARWCA